MVNAAYPDDDPGMETGDRLGSQLRAIRRRRGLTQEQLADLIGRSTDAVSNLERGVSLPSFETLDRLSQRLDVPIREFFDLPEGRETSARRQELLATLADLARSMSDGDLEVAVRQVEALVGREG